MPTLAEKRRKPLTAVRGGRHYEAFSDINNAIAAEKKIKGWTRIKKMQLIKTINPTFRDLSKDF